MKVALLAGGLIAALLAGCAHHDDALSEEHHHYYVAPTKYTYIAPADARVVGVERIGSDGKIVAIEPRVVNTDGYRVTVRGADGVDRTYIMSSLGDIRVGDRVRIDAGHIYPLG